ARSVTMLDSAAPHGSATEVHEYDATDVFRALVENFELKGNRSLAIDASQLALMTPEEKLALLHERLVQVGMIPLDSKAEALEGPLRTFAACLRATYRPSHVYPDRVRLIVLDDTRFDSGPNPARHAALAAQWRRWAPRIDICTVHGNRSTVLQTPRVLT